MKRKYVFLMVASACLGWFGLGTSTAWGQEISASVRIEKIVKVTPTNQLPILPLSLEGTKQIYFDVTMSCDTPWTALENYYDPSLSNGNQRPYLILNIPLAGESSKAGIDVKKDQGETYTETTSTAVAYYAGQGPRPEVLRFVYNVRPGDMTEKLTWATTMSGAPAFGGAVQAIRFSGTKTDWASAVTVSFSDTYLQGDNGNPAVADDAGAVWGVCGYTLQVGDAGNPNSSDLYQGLVPVTVSTPKNYTKLDAVTGAATTVNYPGATAFQQMSLADNCAFWVESWDTASSTWKHLNAGVTYMSPDNVTINTYDAASPATFDTFTERFSAPFSGVTEINATTFDTQKFFVNIPETVAANTRVRLCYGLRPDAVAAGTTAPYATMELKVKAAPVIAQPTTSGYTVQSPMMSMTTFDVPDGTGTKNVSGGEVSLSAGDVETIAILKKNITKLSTSGILYACVEQLSDDNGARADWERYYVPLDPSVSTAAKLKLTIPEDATLGETIYRITIPGLTEGHDAPFYLKVKSSAKREYITIAADTTIGTTGYEAYKDDTVSVLPYTLSVNASDTKRYFKIFPVLGDRETAIPADAYVTDAAGNKILVHDLLKRTVSLQQDNSTDTTTATAKAELRVEVPAGQTSVTFYVLCRNDFPNYMGMLSKAVKAADGKWLMNDTESASYMSGAIFKAKTCNYIGEVTGLNDECPMAIAPKIENVAPTIASATVQSSAATGTTVPFTFTVEDARSDYLIARMDFGDGTTETVLYVNKEEMEATLGAKGWEDHLTSVLQATYPDLAKAENIKERATLVAQQMRFSHAYDVGTANWSLTVIDSTGHSVTQSGLLTLTKAQSFTFYTINKATQPASGYVNWENKGDNTTWSFGDTYTYNSLPLSPSEPNTIRVRAKAYAAGEKPAGATSFGPTSDTLDSFFYKWGVWSEDYAALLPNDNGLYSPLLTINRAFVSGGGEANDPTKWQDIELAAFFVAEYLPGDAAEAYNIANADPANLYDLGDYNRDGIPDGWVLHGGDATARTLIEGASMATQAAEGDAIPAAGWTAGTVAYGMGNNDRLVSQNAPCAAGAAFNYLTRVRGLDEALNAADGEGNWLSVPAWVVLRRPEVQIDPGAGHTALNYAVNVSADMIQVRLANPATEAATGVKIAYTAEQKIPYDENKVDPASGWAPVVDIDGDAIAADPTNADAAYHATSILVQTLATDPDYERFRTTYTLWGYDKEGTFTVPVLAAGSTDLGVLFPYTTLADSDAAQANPVSEIVGAVWAEANGGDGKYHFCDARTPEGILLDEPIRVVKDTNGFIDPRQTSWLDRFAMAGGADTDGDGVVNGMEYYFWYYASRKAWISVFTTTDADGNVQTQVNDALYPAVDVRNHQTANSDEALGTTEVFVMGRRYRNAYDPDLVGGEADGKANFWEPIPVSEVLAGFNPFAHTDGDPDNDGLSTSEEFDLGSNPIDCDSDGDGVPDGWANAFGLDPTAKVGGLNPDYDFFAYATVKLYSNYHHLFMVQTATEILPAAGATDRVFYDYEGKCFWWIPVDIDLLTLAEPEVGDNSIMRIETPEAKIENVTAWADQNAVMMKMLPEERILRDDDVYEALGFNPYTAWCGGLSSSNRKIAFDAVNTLPFSTVEEFKSSVRRAAGGDIDDVVDVSTSPVNADTNADGVPDGWEAYVGYNPVDTKSPDGSKDFDADSLNLKSEFQCLAANSAAGIYIGQGAVGWDALVNETHNTSWTNKCFPTDPNNPDTDFDGIYDGDEADARYCYNPVASSIRGGGMDPNKMDTDNDGMPDGWEFRYGEPSMAAAATEGEEGEDDEEETSSDTTGYPDPTYAGDYDLDPDRDGLPNVQEYLTGLLRQNRYDLTPDMARLYADVPGTRVTLKEDLAQRGLGWETIPDAYLATVDLLNPTETYSVDYVTIGEEPLTIDPLRQNLSMLGYSEAIAAAFNRKWNTSIIFPTADQIERFGLNDPKPNTATPESGYIRASRYITALTEDLQALDAAYQRLLSRTGDPVKNPLLASATANEATDKAQVRALLVRVDALWKALEADGAFVQTVINKLVTGEGATIWDARKNQILGTLEAADTVYDEMTTLANTATPGSASASWKDEYTYPTDDEDDLALAYEEAVRAAESPLLKSQYRDALRGYTGGVWKVGDTYYLGQLGLHNVLTAMDVRELHLGQPLPEGKLLGGNAARIGDLTGETQNRTAKFFTTSPLTPDSDADGMDDYFEVFHGLNPLLGDYLNDDLVNGTSGRAGCKVDWLAPVYALADSTFVRSSVGPTANGFVTDPFTLVTGYDYYSFPWLAGAPQADPDGDGLLNAEEAVNPSGSTPSHYGTDPSPLWMTDPANKHSFVTRFYGCYNGNAAKAIVAGTESEIVPEADLVFTYVAAIGDKAPMLPTYTALPYEINEGFDTDGDGVADITELSSNAILRGDPQTIRTPDRQQAAYFGGEGAMQTHAMTQFGPTSLTTFTIECWVNPDEAGTTTATEWILIDRPWAFSAGGLGSSAMNKQMLRHNFVLGLAHDAGGKTFRPFVRFTGAGTTFESGAVQQVPAQSPTVTATESIEAGKWTHIAATYDGAKLAIIVNGEETNSAQTALIPANGVISLKNDSSDTLRKYTYREAPILIGAGPADNWFAELDNMSAAITSFGSVYDSCYKGFIDEVRIWNGARTPSLIAENRSRSFTQTELLANRLDVFMHRFNNGGYFAANVPTELLASYSFNDLLASAKDATNPLLGADEPWEKYPGEKTIGGDAVPGSLTYRRTGTEAKRTAGAPWGVDVYYPLPPAAAELYTSYYSILAPEVLKSTKYTMDEMQDPVTLQTVKSTEYVPMAHNAVSHLPLMDIELDSEEAFVDISGTSGEPELTAPSGTPENLKPADSVYWTPYAAGTDVTSTKRFDVKTTGNPYGYRYNATKSFDALNYIARQAYTTQYATDLMLYGDVFSKYIAESWDSSPSTDPSAGSGTGGTGTVVDDGKLEWFEYKSETGDTLNDTQLSQGGAYLDGLFPGQTKDSDGDRMPNWWENFYTLDPEDATGDNGPHGDADGDYLTNYAEYLARSNPGKYSTAGNGVPDSQMAIWARRGRPTFGLLYTDNDFMEDHWEADNRSADLSVDFNDATLDADQDGWSNWAEARVVLRGRHSTNPNLIEEKTMVETVRAYPTPAIQLKVDYFGDMTIISNKVNNIIVHAYTAVGNNSAPDATFTLPMATEDGSETTHGMVVGRKALDTVFSGYLEPGNILPGSFKASSTVYIGSSEAGPGEIQDLNDTAIWDNGKGELVVSVRSTSVDPATGEEKTVYFDRVIGELDYTTGKYTYSYSSKNFSGITVINGTTEVNFEDVYLKATYSSQYNAGFPSRYTLVSPSDGHLREGKNNFFVFMDLNENESWDEGEPAGVVDQHDVEIGWDTLATQLHVNLTIDPPPGAVRLSVGRILKQLMGDQLAKIAALQNATTGTTDSSSTSSSSSSTSMMGASSIPHPLNPTQYLDPINFDASLKYDLVLVQYQSLGTTVNSGSNAEVYRKEYNVLKPYLTEEEIFAAWPKGLPGTDAQNQKAFTYKVYLLPETLRENANSDEWFDYNIAIVTNRFGRMVDALTTLPAEKVNGGAIQHNTDLVFEWTSNVQMPSFRLTITKVEDASGEITPTTIYDKEVRGVSAYRKEAGDGANEQFAYRYKLPRGIGELSTIGKPTLFGDGLYNYALTLNAYNGAPKVLNGAFRIQLRSSGDDTLCEKPGSPVSYNAYDSYYVRTKVRYNGVLCETDDFGSPAAPVVIEAHTTASFNDAPVASTNDLMVYDLDDTGTPTAAAAYNGCVRISKDKLYAKTVAGASKNLFWSTLIEAELRGIPSETPVYLMAYIDLNLNGKRDNWEPWGYATMGLDATNGYYFDARAVKPVASGKDFAVEFHIQDVDTDNDKLADSWEWKNAGMPRGDETDALFASWCNTYNGSTAHHQSSLDIWMKNKDGTTSMTAYGASLYGLDVASVNADGSVNLSTPMPEDLALAQELMSIIGDDTALALFEQGYVVYAIDVSDIAYDATTGAMTINWEIAEGNSVLDGSTVDLAAIFAEAATQSAVYTIYGTDTPSGTWKPLATINVAGATAPSVNLTKEMLTLGDDAQTATFFKVMLSTKASAE